jgi:deoxyribonuclease IV
MIKFGPAGNAESFYSEGYKHTYEVFEWLNKKGLNAYEYSCGRGVKIKEETAVKIGENAKKYDVQISIHAPYYINLATEDEEKRQKNIGYLFDSAKVLKLMGGKRVVFHPGSHAKMDKGVAFSNIKNSLAEIVDIFKANDLSDMLLCAETMGKKNQSGDLDEIMQLCSIDDMIMPTIDFGHLHARGLGAINTISDYEVILDKMKDELPDSKYKNFHSHFSKIEFTKGGEKKHRTFEENAYGPEFKPLASLIYERGLTPTFICESKGTQADDAMKMKEDYYDQQ